MSYKFKKDELLKLLIRAYDEGNCGFLDLAESVAEKLIEENKDKYEEEISPVLLKDKDKFDCRVTHVIPLPYPYQTNTLLPCETRQSFTVVSCNTTDVKLNDNYVYNLNANNSIHVEETN